MYYILQSSKQGDSLVQVDGKLARFDTFNQAKAEKVVQYNKTRHSKTKPNFAIVVYNQVKDMIRYTDREG